MTATTIDHTAYPYLIDMILGYADERGLLAMRGTSRAFRDAMDVKLLGHVALLVAPERVDVPDPETHRTRIAYRDKVVGHVRISDLRAAVPGPPLRLNLPSAVRVLDIKTPIYSTSGIEGASSARVKTLGAHVSETLNARALALNPPINSAAGIDGAAYTRLKTLRRSRDAVWATPPTLPSVTTMVDFLAFPRRILYYEQSPSVRVPPGLKRYVLHLRRLGLETSETPIFMDVFDSWRTSTEPAEMVLVLHDQHAPFRPNNHRPLLEHLYYYILFVLEGGGSVCVVGIEEAHEGMDKRQAFRDTLKARWKVRAPRKPPSDDKVGAFVAQVDFTTIDEWHARLREEGRGEDGFDAYEMQAVWPP